MRLRVKEKRKSRRGSEKKENFYAEAGIWIGGGEWSYHRIEHSLNQLGKLETIDLPNQRKKKKARKKDEK